jgi:hypothetical protein
MSQSTDTVRKYLIVYNLYFDIVNFDAGTRKMYLCAKKSVLDPCVASTQSRLARKICPHLRKTRIFAHFLGR